VALSVLNRIDETDAYVQLVLPAALSKSGLVEADRRLVTELVAGTTRMRRALDAMIDRFVVDPPDGRTRNLLRLGAYQIAMTRIPDHAAVHETVGLAPRRVRGFINAVLRRIVAEPMQWPDRATELSYPNWIVERLRDELGESAAFAALASMNTAPSVTIRSDGYIQDTASQLVALAVGARAGELIADLCAAPGGKTTALASAGAGVVAVELHRSRAKVIAANAERVLVDPSVVTVVNADARSTPLRRGVFDAVLVDAPCSGLGVLRRRADARWRMTADAIDGLVVLQRSILAEAAELVRPGGRLIYSVCTLTAAESVDHAIPDGFVVDEETPGDLWQARAHGWVLLPHLAGTDGMTMIRFRRRAR
jgi:16S rRNA (cytosine967-C5)-methyltransferase